LKTIHKTYRFAATFTLILFVSNILLPAGILAASLHCDMEMPNKKHTHACCMNTGNENHQRESVKVDESCPMLSFCKSTIDERQSDQPALTQASKIVIAADLTNELAFEETDRDHPRKFSDESESASNSPPIFLLNSTFLN
jgi:hypothetical protein